MRRYLNYFKPIIAILVILALVFSLVPAMYGMNRVGRSALQLSKQGTRIGRQLPSTGPAIFRLLNKPPQGVQFQSDATGPAHLFDGSLIKQPKKVVKVAKIPKGKKPKISTRGATPAAPASSCVNAGGSPSLETPQREAPKKPALKPVPTDDLLRYAQRGKPAAPAAPTIDQVPLQEQPHIESGNVENLLKASVQQGVIRSDSSSGSLHHHGAAASNYAVLQHGIPAAQPAGIQTQNAGGMHIHQPEQSNFSVISGTVPNAVSSLHGVENNQSSITTHQAPVHYAVRMEQSPSAVATVQKVPAAESRGNIEKSPKPAAQVIQIQQADVGQAHNNGGDKPAIRVPEKTVHTVVTPVRPDQPGNDVSDGHDNDADNNRRHPINNPAIDFDEGAKRAHEQQDRPDPRIIRIPRMVPALPIIPQQPEPMPRPVPVVPENPENNVPALPMIPYVPMPEHNKPTKPKPKKPTPKPSIKPAVPKKRQNNVEQPIRPMTKELAIIDLEKLVIADRNSAGQVRFGGQHRMPSQVQKRSAHLAAHLPADLAQLREEFIKAHGGNMHKEGAYAGCNHQAYEAIMAGIRKYKESGLLASPA